MTLNLCHLRTFGFLKKIGTKNEDNVFGMSIECAIAQIVVAETGFAETWLSQTLIFVVFDNRSIGYH